MRRAAGAAAGCGGLRRARAAPSWRGWLRRAAGAAACSGCRSVSVRRILPWRRPAARCSVAPMRWWWAGTESVSGRVQRTAQGAGRPGADAPSTHSVPLGSAAPPTGARTSRSAVGCRRGCTRAAMAIFLVGYGRILPERPHRSVGTPDHVDMRATCAVGPTCVPLDRVRAALRAERRRAARARRPGAAQRCRVTRGRAAQPFGAGAAARV